MLKDLGGILGVVGGLGRRVLGDPGWILEGAWGDLGGPWEDLGGSWELLGEGSWRSLGGLGGILKGL